MAGALSRERPPEPGVGTEVGQAGALAPMVEVVCGAPSPPLLEHLARLGDAQRAVTWAVWWSGRRETPGGGKARLAARLGELPEAAHQRLYTAPEVWSLLHGATMGERRDVDCMSEWIAAEAVVAGHPAPVERPLWTALGDFLAEPAAGTPVATPQGRRLALGPVLDLSSPATTLPLREIPGSGERWSTAEAELVTQRMQGASELVTSCRGPWRELVARFVRVVLARKDPSLDGVSSSSTRLALGRVVLRNPHLPEVSFHSIADGLIHEMVHTLLDHWELAAPLVRVERPQLLESPWSGKSLDLNTFVQACFVWGALFHFWVDALRSGAVEAPIAVRLIRARAGGFLVEPPLEARLEGFRGALGHGVLESVASLRQRVLEQVEGR